MSFLKDLKQLQPVPVGFPGLRVYRLLDIWVVVKIKVPFWVPIIVRHLLFRVPKKGP